jgi:hypothetical protein
MRQEPLEVGEAVMGADKPQPSGQALQEDARRKYEKRVARSPEEEEFLRQLLERGLLDEITPPVPFEDLPKNRQLIPVQGQPVSEFLLEERR